MPRAEGRPRKEPLRDPENCLINYVIVGRTWETFKCDLCDRPFPGDGWIMWPDGRPVELGELGGEGQRHGYGASVSDAVRVRSTEDWEYRPGEWTGHACPACARRVEAAWDVMPGEPGREGIEGA